MEKQTKNNMSSPLPPPALSVDLGAYKSTRHIILPLKAYISIKHCYSLIGNRIRVTQQYWYSKSTLSYLILSAGFPFRIGFSLSRTKKAPSGNVFNMVPAFSRCNLPTYLQMKNILSHIHHQNTGTMLQLSCMLMKILT